MSVVRHGAFVRSTTQIERKGAFFTGSLFGILLAFISLLFEFCLSIEESFVLERSHEKKNVRGVYMESHAASISQVRRVGGGAFASMLKADLQMSFPLRFWAVLVSM